MTNSQRTTTLAGAAIPVVASVGDLEVLQSGVIHLENSKEFKLKVGELLLVLVFANDEGGSRYQGRVEGDVLYLDLFNHDAMMGEGALTPLQFAELNDRPIYLTYWTQAIDKEKTARRLEYAIYAGAENG